MRCVNCKRVIPETSKICPFCKEDPNTEVISVTDFGEINDDLYANDEKFDIKTYIKEPRNKKIIIFSCVLIILVIGIFSFLIINLFRPKKDTSYKYFTGIVDKLSDYIIDNFLSNNSIKSGDYSLELSLSDYQTKFEGKYSFDLKTKKSYIDGHMRDPKEDEGEIVFENKEFTYTLYANKNNIYLKSKEFYSEDEYILFPIEDELGILTSNNYNMENIIRGFTSGIDESLKKLKYKTGNEEISYKDKNIKSDYVELELNNSNLKDFYNNFYNALKEETNFINEFSRIKNKKSSEIIETLENYRKTKEYEYNKDDDGNNPSIKIYYTDSKIYSISFINKDKTIKMDIGDTKYYFKYYVDSTLKSDFELTIVKNQVQDVINKTIEVTYKIDDKTGVITLKMISKEKGKMIDVSVEKEKSVRDFTDDDLNKIKTNMSYYKENIGDYIQALFDSYDYKCKPTLDCVCDEEKEKCSCAYNGEMITCKYDEVKK